MSAEHKTSAPTPYTSWPFLLSWRSRLDSNSESICSARALWLISCWAGRGRAEAATPERGPLFKGWFQS